MKIYYLIEKKGKKRQMLPCAYAECIDDALEYTRQNSGVFCIVRVKETQFLKDNVELLHSTNKRKGGS